jgi:hypothetical protein
MKKIIFIVVGVIIVGFGVWFLFFHKIPVSSTSSISTSSPFGVAPGDISSSGGVSGSAGTLGTSGTASGTLPTLFKISGDPVAGAVVIVENGQEVVRYSDRATGHIYDVDPLTLQKIEVANTTLPEIYQALWKPDGSQVIYRSLSDDGNTSINTSLALTAPKSTSTGAEYNITTTQLQGNVSAMVGGIKQIAYVLKDTGSVGISGFAGEKPQTILSSAFSEWQIAWNTTNLELTTNASASTEGFSYSLNTASGSLTKVLGPLTALTTLADPAGGQILYSYIDTNANTVFAVENTKTGVSTTIMPATFPEKCVWSLQTKNTVFCGAPSSAIDANEPDSWYQGITHFSDQIWEFNTSTGNATLLADPKKNFGVDIDLINPTLSPNEDYLVFMNKTDLSLWALKLSSE